MRGILVWSAVLFVAMSLVGERDARAEGADDSVWRLRAEFRPYLIRSVPTLLASQDRETGRFGTGIWIVTDQNALFPLAVAWSLPGEDNAHYHDPELLEAIMDGGDALINDQNAKGMWEFRKKDGSTWGDTYMPWTYSRWVRAFLLIKDAMPPERRERWEKALTLGYEGISRTTLTTLTNIPAHHAMGLYHAGVAFNRPDWKAKATTFLRRVAAAQHPDGYWTEHSGPVVMYNGVYVDALSAYFAVSGDQAIRPALERSALFHSNLTYPDGSAIETVDERNAYSASIVVPNHGFTVNDLGRGYVRSQWNRYKARSDNMSADLAAGYLMYGQEGPTAPAPSEVGASRFALSGNQATVRRASPWCVVLSAYTAPFIQNRWMQDRQNMVSLFHEKTGLILGGGNTRLQPLWSTFTVGDTSLLYHNAGDESPDFSQRPGLRHVPDRARIQGDSVELHYGGTRVRVRVEPMGPTSARLIYTVLERSEEGPVEAHIPLITKIGTKWETASGRSGLISEKPIQLAPGEAGGWLAHGGWRMRLPEGARMDWPAIPHNPYAKDGASSANLGRLVVTLPFPPGVNEHTVTVYVL